MKPGLLYGIIFFVAFLAITGVIYFIAGSNPQLLLLSSNKAKISAKTADEMGGMSGTAEGKITAPKSKRIKLVEEKPNEEGYSEIDTIKGVINKTRVEVRYDTVYTQKLVKDPSVVDSLNKKVLQIKLLLRQNKQKDFTIKKLKKRIVTKIDSTYQAWVKSTVKLYEAMSPSEAAKLIQKLSDNHARDLIYKMKNKKAAAILSNLNTELVVKLTEAK